MGKVTVEPVLCLLNLVAKYTFVIMASEYKKVKNEDMHAIFRSYLTIFVVVFQYFV